MRRILTNLFLALYFVASIAGPASAAPLPKHSGPQYNPGSVAVTGGNVEFVVKEAFVPVGIGPTGTMGNNGAVTWGTALPRAYTAGAFFFVPAGAIAAGVPAAITAYWYVGTNTTTGTFYNVALSASLDSDGAPVVPTSPAAFATTGPGAFTGVTAEQTLVSITIPASTISSTGHFDFEASYSYNATATNKLTTLAFAISAGGGNVISANVGSSLTQGTLVGFVANQNNAAIQYSRGSVAGLTSNPAEFTANTATALVAAFKVQHTTATDVAIIEGFRIKAKK